MTQFPIQRTTQHKPVPEDVSTSFGGSFSDHMFVMEYDAPQGWHDPRIVPFGSLSLHPSCSAIQYSQSIFDGFKGYHCGPGDIRLFRPQAHFARFNRSAERLCMPPLDPALALQAVQSLVDVDRAWVPQAPGTAIYVRPTMIGTEGFMSVRPANAYLFVMFLSPVGAYYAEGAKPVRIKVATEHVRAAAWGGVGFAKTGGNYAASLMAAKQAHEEGFTQVLWLDSTHRRFIEEVGTMNIMAKIDGEIVTPPLGDSILAGITRDTVLTLMRDWGLNVSERPLAIDEVVAASEAGTLEEMWGTGTAAVVSPVGELSYKGRPIVINHREVGETTKRLLQAVTDLQYGMAQDKYGWSVKVPETQPA
jgi:branched-chain amino acid aminotransferase